MARSGSKPDWGGGRRGASDRMILHQSVDEQQQGVERTDKFDISADMSWH